MSDLRKAAEMALKVLEHSLGYSNEAQAKISEAKQTLRQALAQPEQEPVAWINKDGWFRSPKDADAAFRAYAFPLYAAPPKREWVGLTDDEIKSCNEFTTDWGQSAVWLWDDDFEEGGIQFARALETKLKEKNT